MVGDRVPVMNKNYKLLILGDTFVGKTSLIQEYLGNRFCDSYKPTIEDIYTKTVLINNKKLDLKFYDVSLELLNLYQEITPSQRKQSVLIPKTVWKCVSCGLSENVEKEKLRDNKNMFRPLILKSCKCKSEPMMTMSYINICDAFIFIYSIANRKSFQSVKELLDIIYTNNCQNMYINKPLYVIGTKLDLSEKREITKKEGITLSLEYNAFHYETSVITGQNIGRSLQTIIRNTINSQKRNLVIRSSSMYTLTDDKLNQKSVIRSNSMYTSTLEKIAEKSNQKSNEDKIIIIDTSYKNDSKETYINIKRARSNSRLF